MQKTFPNFVRSGCNKSNEYYLSLELGFFNLDALDGRCMKTSFMYAVDNTKWNMILPLQFSDLDALRKKLNPNPRVQLTAAKNVLDMMAI